MIMLKRFTNWLSRGVVAVKRVTTPSSDPNQKGYVLVIIRVVATVKRAANSLSRGVIRAKDVITSWAVVTAERINTLWRVINAKRVTTLYVGDDAVHLMVAKGKRVEKWASLELEPGVVSQGIVLDEAKLAGSIDKLFREPDISKKNVTIGLSGSNSIYRLISLPTMPKTMISSAVEHEARRVIPTPLEEVYISYQILPSPRGEISVFLAAYPRNILNSQMKALQLAGVKPAVMDLAPLALCRTIDQSRAIVVNARADAVAIMVMEDRLPQLIRWLSLPGEFVSLEDRLPLIIEEIDRTVAFHNVSHRQNPLDETVPMFVSGDLVAAEPESLELLAGKLKCPVSTSTLPVPLEYPEIFDPNEFIVNVGLTIKELLPKRIKEDDNFSIVNFNALPGAYLPRRLPLPDLIAAAGIVIVAGLLAYTVSAALDKADSNSELRSDITTVESSIAEAQSDISTLEGQISQVGADILLAQAEEDIFNTTFILLNTGQAVMDGDLSEIVTQLPVDGSIDLSTVIHTGGVVTITGIATSEDDVFTYYRDLETRFPDIHISSISAEAGGYSFTILLKY